MRVGEPSETALRVALNTVTSGGNPAWRPLVPSEPYTAACIREHSPRAARMLRSWRNPVTRWVLYGLREHYFPGSALWILLRKRAVADAVRAAFDAGIGQLVVVGAGLDSLAACLCRDRPDLRAWELETPATMMVKARGLSAAGGVPSNLYLLATDLGTVPLTETLAAAPGFDPSQPAILVAEGVLMYLESAAVTRLLGDARAALAPGSKVIFTFMDAAPLDNPRHPAARAIRVLESLGEPVHWSLRRGDIDQLLTRHGFLVSDLWGVDELRQRVLKPLVGAAYRVMEGELIALADVR